MNGEEERKEKDGECEEGGKIRGIKAEKEEERGRICLRRRQIEVSKLDA
jgi:hypothetical protein